MSGKSAIIAKRVEKGETISDSRLEELISLANSAGYEVTDIITQKRPEHPEYNFGPGKLQEIHHSISRTDSTALITDVELGPYQKYNIGIYIKDGVRVLDKNSLILEIFDNRSETKLSQLQVELARLRYELPRADVRTRLAKKDEHPGFMGLGEYDDSRKEDIRRRISQIESELETISKTRFNQIQEQKKNGIEFVSIAGYTNAGKSTLFRKLAEDHSADENDDLHPDLEPTAESSDELFTTLETTTRRMEVQGRDIFLTDTIGFIHSLPEWIVRSFEPTLKSIYISDVVIIVVDVTEPVSKIYEKVATCKNHIHGKLDVDSNFFVVFNKSDKVGKREIQQKKSELQPIVGDPVFVSAKEGYGIEKVKNRIKSNLPPLQTAEVSLPLRDESMSVVSWVYDNANVNNITYGSNTVTLSLDAKDRVIQKLYSKTERNLT